MSRERYVKLFNDESKSRLAIKLLNDGFSFSFIGNLLDCHRTSVYSFKKKMEKEGVLFKKIGNKLDIIYNRNHRKNKSSKIKPSYSVEKVSRGKTYKGYLKEANKGRKKIVAERMRMAKKNILEARKKQEKELKKIKKI